MSSLTLLLVFTSVDLLLSVNTVLLSLVDDLVEDVLVSETEDLLAASLSPLFTVVLPTEDTSVGEVVLLLADLVISSVPVVLLPKR